MIKFSRKMAKTAMTLRDNPVLAHCGKFEKPHLGPSFLGDVFFSGPSVLALIIFSDFISRWLIIRNKDFLSAKRLVNSN